MNFEDILGNSWGYCAGVLVWVCDHWSGIAAFILFTMQFIFQLYRITKARRDCKED